MVRNNDIDYSIVGPAAPSSHPTRAHPRYSKALFSSETPEFIHPSSRSILLQEALDGVNAASRQRIREQTLRALTPMGQPPGYAIGFFEQGLLVGATILGASTVMSLALVGAYAIPAVMKRLR